MRRTIALLFLMAALWPSTAPAQPPPELRPTVITIRPAAEPVPALKYRLVPEQIKLVPGNAAIFYHRAVHIMDERYSSLRAREKEQPGTFPDSLMLLGSATWLNCPIGEIPRERARKYLEPFQDALKEAELGALRSTCDWEFDQRPGEGTDLQLPEIQGVRGIGRLIQLRARLAILDGKPDEAMHWIEIGFVMGRHVSQGPLWVQALIGVAISRTMTARLEDLIQAPGAPSLYWALADRPRPFVDMRRSMEGERYLLEKELPELEELDRGAWSLDQARHFAETLQHKLFDLSSGRQIPGTYVALPIGLPDMSRRFGVALMAAKIYPEARRALIARGRSEAQLEAMPVIQVAALHSMEEYRRLRDGSYKWTHVPYWQSYNQIDRAILSAGDQKLANPLVALFLMLTPPINQVRLASILLERELDVMQCIEAIRLYASAHEGKLPDSLESTIEAPVPPDPATGRPFLYQLNGDSATLSAPVPPGFKDPYAWRSWQSYATNYELRLAR